ncbi:hypothetical protein ACT7DJ_34850 [Bacillus cereus]
MKQAIAAILIVGLVITSTWLWSQNRALQNKVQKNREEMDGTSQRIDSRK